MYWAYQFLRSSDESRVAFAKEWAKQNNEKVLILGGGSNVVISDQGISGLVIHNKLKGIDTTVDEDVAIPS